MEYYQMTPMEISLHIEGIYSFHLFEYIKNFKGICEKHNFWELVYLDYGKITVISDEDQFSLKAGECFLHQPNELHNILSEGEYASVIIISFGCFQKELYSLAKKILHVRGDVKKVFETTCGAGKQIFAQPWDLFDQQNVVLKSSAPFAMQQMFVRSFEMFLLALIQEQTSLVGGGTKSSEQTVLQLDQNTELVIGIMKEHLYDKISLEDICRESGFSKSYLARMFQKTFESGVMDYYNQMRIKEARRLISEGNLSFTMIAEKLNFSSIHYFSKCFKQHTGMTPNKYKSTIQMKMTI